MKQIPEYEFCMKQFKIAIIGLTVLVVAVLFWTTIHCVNHPETMNFQLIAANTPEPTAPPIKVTDKMLHGYWGNCSKCHLVTDVGKPISKVMTGPKISVNDKMLHKYWGNCLLCHVNTDGIPPKMNPHPVNNAKTAAATQLSNSSLGMSLHAVDHTLRDQFGLAIAQGLLVLDVTPNSIAQKSNIQKGDVITRVQKTPVTTVQAFQTVISMLSPGTNAKIRIHRGKSTRNVFVRIPRKNGNMQMNGNMTQNQVETLAEQLGVSKTQQAVTNALQQQKNTQQVARQNMGTVAFASMGSGLGSNISYQFASSTYFILYDPMRKAYRTIANPNANDLTGQDVQTAQFLVDMNVSNVVAGNFSPAAMNALHTLRINVYPGVSGSIKDLLDAYMAGQLMPVQ
jgi:predicted Fe-Mo cluster-binding NifX family protein